MNTDQIRWYSEQREDGFHFWFLIGPDKWCDKNNNLHQLRFRISDDDRIVYLPPEEIKGVWYEHRIAKTYYVATMIFSCLQNLNPDWHGNNPVDDPFGDKSAG